MRQFLRDQYGVYNYGYTAVFTDDIHVDKGRLPQAMKELLGNFKKYEFFPYGPGQESKAGISTQNMTETEEYGR